MRDTPGRGSLWLGCLLSLVCCLLVGCGGSDGTGGSTTVATRSQLVLHVTTPDQERSGLTPRAVTPGQTRQAESITLLRVEVSGPGIPTPLVAECPLPGPETPQCQVTETPDAFIVTIALLVPVGPAREVVVTGFDQSGAARLRGMGTVDLTQPSQTVSVMLAQVSSNTPPRADAGPDQTVAVGTTVMVFGTGSSDAEGDPLTFAWVVLVRPPGSAALIANPTSVTPTFGVDRPGVYVVQLTVNDGQVDSQPDVVTISTVNSAPVANAGEAQTVTVGTTVRLQGIGSSDVDGDLLTFRWEVLTRPIGSQATLSDPSAVTPTFVADRPGSYVAQLLVNDGTLDSPPATVTITTLNSPPLANAGPDQPLVSVPHTVQLDGSASSDADGDALTFRWAFTSRPPGSQATLSNSTTVTPTFVADVLGTYVAQLLVNDGTLDSPPATVMITADNLRPVANAGPDQPLVSVPQSVQLDGSASSDADGDALTFRWAFTSRPPGSQATLSNSTTVTPTFVADVLGTYVAQLLVNDGTLDSPPATVMITADNLRPVANAGPDQTLLFVGQTAQLDGSASSDADGDALTFRWALTTRPAGSQATLANATMVNPTFVADVLGTYVAQLLVNDGTLDSPPATVMITADNLRPVANAGPDQTLLFVGQTAQLDGSASSDADGDALIFRWAFTSRPPGSQATLSNSTTVTPTFVADVLGTYVAQLLVNDGTLDSPPDTVMITADNLRPVANAGPDQTLLFVGQTAQLDGSASSDADGDVLTFRWAFTSRPPGSQATLLNSTTVTPTFVANVLGTYVAQLLVNDGTLDSPPDTVMITADNLRPVANAGPDQTLVSGSQPDGGGEGPPGPAIVQLDGSASSDADGDVLTFRWAFTSRPPGSQATLTNATTVNPTFVADVLGTYVVQLIVNDGTLDSASDSVTIRPFATGSVTDPVGDATVTPLVQVSPDLVSAVVNTDGVTLTLEVRLAPGTFDLATLCIQFSLDTDQNPNTGFPGVDSGNNDRALIGVDFFVDIGALVGGQARVGQSTVPAEVLADGYRVSIPLMLLNNDDGRLNFKVITFVLLSPTTTTGILDYMPNLGLPPGMVQ